MKHSPTTEISMLAKQNSINVRFERVNLSIYLPASHFVQISTISVSHNKMHECELTNLSRTAVDAAAWSSSVAERRRPADVAVTVSFVVTHLQRITNPGQIPSSSSSSPSSSCDVSFLNKSIPTP